MIPVKCFIEGGTDDASIAWGVGVQTIVSGRQSSVFQELKQLYFTRLQTLIQTYTLFAIDILLNT